jgi:hypothetical protein
MFLLSPPTPLLSFRLGSLRLVFISLLNYQHSIVNAMFDGEYYKQMRSSGLDFDFGDGLVM